jgi:GTP-binding protein EngB required for normal cell division
MDAPRDNALNESQQRRLIVTCQYVDRLLGDLERAFIEAQSNSPFGRYANDLAPAEQRLVHDYIGRLRTQLVRMLDGQGLSPAPHRFGLRHSLLTHLTFVDVAVEELKPHYMQGYGAVAADAAAALNGIVEELHGTIGQLTRALAVDRSEDLRTRLEKIGIHADVELLDTLEELVTKYGLVEFRSALATILDTLERRGLELAVFGRVSTGKSSLLNRLLEREVLPVGVTPITAVPTRITFGRRPRLRVAFADTPARDLEIRALAEYASERENPANAKRVMRLVVELPAPFLESGVTLVDTPGLGSLATAGAAETLAYLPHCDVAAVLVDASSTITAEDLATVALLVNAGIHVSVLVSKADLLDSADLDATLTYARQVLVREFNTAVPVAAVSVKLEFDHLFAQWRTQEPAPLIADQERERQQAAARKMAILRAQIEARLRQSLATGERGPRAPEDDRATDLTLQMAAGQITDLERRIDALTLVLPRQAPEVLSRAAALISDKVPSRQALMQAFRDVTGEAAQDVARDLQTLATSLSDVHRRVAQTLDRSNHEDAETLERAATIREVPIPDLPPDLSVPAEGAERLFGRGLAQSVVLKRLERHVGDAVRATLESYAAVLRRWALDALEAIRSQWTATTDGARADLDRRMGHAQNRPIDSRDLQRDLERLAVSALR